MSSNPDVFRSKNVCVKYHVLSNGEQNHHEETGKF